MTRGPGFPTAPDLVGIRLGSWVYCPAYAPSPYQWAEGGRLLPVGESVPHLAPRGNGSAGLVMRAVVGCQSYCAVVAHLQIQRHNFKCYFFFF